MTVPRPKNQQARREHLVAAARRAIVEQGLAAVRIRDVAEAAGMAPGSVTYYYRELDELFGEVYDDAVQRFCAERWRTVEAIEDPRERLVVNIRAGLPSGPDDELAALLYEFSPQARRRKLEAVLRSTLYSRQVDLYRAVIEGGVATGAFQLAAPAPSIARNLVALEDAYGYHVVVGSAVSLESAEELIRSYASTVTGCDLDEVAAGLATAPSP
jgi:AcrR family transcriptional regulator